MALTDLLNVPGLDPNQNDWMKNQQLLALGASLLQAGAPSTDPRNRSLAFAIGQGLQGLAGARQAGMGQLMQGSQFQAWQEEQERQKKLRDAMSQIKTTETVPVAPDLSPADVGYPFRPEREVPRGMADIMREAAEKYLQAGEPESAAKIYGATANEELKKLALDLKERALELKANGGEKTDHYTIQNIKNPKDIRSVRLRPGEAIPEGYKIREAEGMQLNPQTLQALADRFGASGEIPGMGMGKAATEARTKVLNAWAENLKKTATTPQEQLAQQASYKAAAAELKRLQGQRGVVMAFANTADKNLDLVSQLSDKVDRTGMPVVNRWLLAGKRSLAGDPDVSKFDAAVRTAINEYARVTSSATGGGVTSDQARKEVEAMLNTAQTKEQVTEVIKLLRQEMGNRRKGYDDQIKTIQDAISGKKSGEQPKKRMTFNPDSGAFE